LVNLVTSDLVLAIEVLSDNCLTKIKEIVGSLRREFGSDDSKPGVYGSENSAGAAK
jgi:hypothetical protein